MTARLTAATIRPSIAALWRPPWSMPPGLAGWDYLTDLLGGEPVSVKDVTKEAASAKSLRSAREALGIKPEKSGFEGGWVWTLP
jgi:hypothetical protein